MTVEDEGRTRETARTEPAGDTDLVGDRDREVVVGRLQQHHVDGRLTLDEFKERVRLALEARTVGDLTAVSQHLPTPSAAQITTHATARHAAPRPLPVLGARHRVGVMTAVASVGGLAAWWFS